MQRWLFLGIWFGWVAPLLGATYYVSNGGDDAADGTSPDTAWKSLENVHGTRFQPGDKILFERGGLWRGSLVPCSGEPGNPILYGAYGDGKRPVFYGSVDACDPTLWKEVAPGIWKMDGRAPYQRGEKMAVDLNQGWSLHTEGGASANVRIQTVDGRTQVVLTVTKSGTAPHHVQLWGPLMESPLPRDMELIMRARASVPCVPEKLRVDESRSPWRMASFATVPALKPEWTEYTLLFSRGMLPSELEHPLRIHWSLGKLPEGTFTFEFQELYSIERDRTKGFSTDVGNIIFDHGHSKTFLADKPERKNHTCGTKKWRWEDLREVGDYLYCGQNGASTSLCRVEEGPCVYLRSNGNPASQCQSLELALHRGLVNMGGKQDVILENLAFRYTAGHGIGGGTTARLVIRKCDFSYIGGAHQFTREGGYPVRYGNAIEFWGSADGHLVEENRIWEVYDAALTNQGRGSAEHPSIEQNITYRKNLIWNSEYSFEYWNNNVTENILFEDNLCFDAGYGWAHSQRPDKNGAHVMFYNNSAATKNFVLRNNVFCNSTEVCLRMDNDWRDSLTLENNVYWQDKNPLVRFQVKNYFQRDELERYQQETGMDRGSRLEKRTMESDASDSQ